MLVYEKKVEGNRHLYGTRENVPAANDAQLKYKDSQSVQLDLSITDQLVSVMDEQTHKYGIKRLSDGAFFGVFIGDDGVAIIPQGWMVDPVDHLTVKTAPDKTTYSAGEALDMTGVVITVTFENTKILDVAYGDPRLSYTPAEGTALETTHTKVTIGFADCGKTVDQAITVS